MNSIRATERQMRKLQMQRHMYDIKMMILSNPLFKNLNERDQKKLARLIYKAEMIETFMRDKQIVRINESFEDIVEGVANMLNEVMRDEDEDEEDR
jgi:TRAP-type C4-dicarboxylate transport system substrate-binding protein